MIICMNSKMGLYFAIIGFALEHINNGGTLEDFALIAGAIPPDDRDAAFEQYGTTLRSR
jgi:hypothetical protein